MRVFSAALPELIAANPAHKYMQDPDRREELVRVVLAQLNFRPADESIEQATDRLSTISGSERKRLLEASRVTLSFRGYSGAASCHRLYQFRHEDMLHIGQEQVAREDALLQHRIACSCAIPRP